MNTNKYMAIYGTDKYGTGTYGSWSKRTEPAIPTWTVRTEPVSEDD